MAVAVVHHRKTRGDYSNGVQALLPFFVSLNIFLTDFDRNHSPPYMNYPPSTRQLPPPCTDEHDRIIGVSTQIYSF